MIRVNVDIGGVIASLNGKIESILPGGAQYESLQRTVGISLLGDVKTRIHENGLASDGTKIGSYSTKPMYVSVKANVGRSFGRPIGKTGLSKFKTGEKKGKDHTSRYFPGGYNQYKTVIGRNQLGSVNLSLSGTLNNQLTLQATERGYGIGWANAELYKRAKALEKKYGKPIWMLTDEETGKTISIAKNFVNRALS